MAPRQGSPAFEVARMTQSSPAVGGGIMPERRCVRCGGGVATPERAGERCFVPARLCRQQARARRNDAASRDCPRGRSLRRFGRGQRSEGGAGAKQARRAVGNAGAGEIAEATGIGTAFHAPGKGGENDAEAGSGLRAAHRRRDLLPADWRCPSGVPSLLRADSPCPAGVRACSFYFLRVLRGAFHKTKPAFGRKAGRAFREVPRTTKETSWPVRGR